MSKKKQEIYINRDLSWLTFNERVLQEAMSPLNPLIERLIFLGIYSNNLDEFYRVRVAILSRLVSMPKTAALDFDAEDVFKEIQKTVTKQQKKFEQIYDDLILALEKENIFIIDETEVTETQGEYLRKHFRDEIRQHLFPLMLDRFKNATLLKDNSIYLVADLKKKDARSVTEETYALIELPTNDISRFVVLPKDEQGRHYVILLDDVIRYCQAEIFSSLGCNKFEAYTIKFTRDAELDLDNDLSKSYIEIVAESIKKRKLGETVRFIYDKKMPDKLLKTLMKTFNIKKQDSVIKGGRYHNFKDFMKFPRLGGRHLQYDYLPRLYASEFHGDTPMFDVIRKQDVMLHYPYQTFQHIIDLLREASIDPNVRAIKMTIYRAAKDSRVINALINAVRNGKKVTVYIELQARFDEEANIHWANRMQEEGITILNNIPGFKVHGKLLLIRRKESCVSGNSDNKYYAVVGTGNPNEMTSKIYADEHLLTANEQITSEINSVFHFLEGKKYIQPNFLTIVVSPFYTRDFFSRMIDREIENARHGKTAAMLVKLNNLVDKRIVDKLYEASQAGVKIDLIVRGICVLVPGVKNLSENIRAVRIIDRFLEHSRIFVFYNGGNKEFFIGSADWMDRNFDHRIEVTVPIFDETIKKDLCKMLDIQLSDNTKSLPINVEKERKPKKNEKQIRSQYAIHEYLKQKGETLLAQCEKKVKE